MKQILLVGATGLVGSHVLQQALASVQPMSLDAPPLQDGAPDRLD